jgi:hypothetical protein
MAEPLSLVRVQPVDGESYNHPLHLIPRPELRLLPSNVPGPGRILNKVYTSAGRVLEDRANHLAHKHGLGPIAATNRIQKALGDSAKARLAMMKVLYRQTGSDRDLQELWGDCHKLMKYARP